MRYMIGCPLQALPPAWSTPIAWPISWFMTERRAALEPPMLSSVVALFFLQCALVHATPRQSLERKRR